MKYSFVILLLLFTAILYHHSYLFEDTKPDNLVTDKGKSTLSQKSPDRIAAHRKGFV